MTEQGCVYPGKSEQHTPSDVRVALPVGVGVGGCAKARLESCRIDKMNQIMVKRALAACVRGAYVELTWSPRGTYVILTWTYQSRRITTIRVAYNALEVVPVEPGARRYFPR